jgi:hypothetical protein
LRYARQQLRATEGGQRETFFRHLHIGSTHGALVRSGDDDTQKAQLAGKGLRRLRPPFCMA